jgi:hypothetical protein
MAAFDFTAPAELFPSHSKGFKRKVVTYKRFDTAAGAIRYAIEELDPALLSHAVLQVEDERFEVDAIKALYASPDYPLK